MYEYRIHIEVEANSEEEAQARFDGIVQFLNANWDVDVIDPDKEDN